MSKKNKGGRPPQFIPDDLEELQRRIDQYFIDCMGEVLKDNEGNPMIDKWGNPIVIGAKPWTVTGLALAIGFNSRQALLNYQNKPEFFDTITRAKAMVEQYAEERLFDKDGANGAKFSLANNFDGWREKQQIEADVKNAVTICIDLVEDDEE